MTWADTYQRLVEVSRRVSSFVLFRGHRSAEWPLLPFLGRRDDSGAAAALERYFYFQHVTRAGDLLQKTSDSWDIAFSMQHHGLPTRFLDWSEVLGVALYFAVKNADSDAAIWVLDPLKLNKASTGRGEIYHARELPAEYKDYFLTGESKPPGSVVALWPLHKDPRILRQRGAFTMHAELTTPLEQLYPSALQKIVISREDHGHVRDLLRIGGISEFSLFPDLDGLARELKSEFWKAVT